MTLPTILAIADSDMDAANHGAADVYARDTALASALESLDIATNIYNDKSAIIFGPIRTHIQASVVTLVDWVVPAIGGDATVELWDLHVAPIAGSAGGTSLDVSNTATIQVETDTDANGSFAFVDAITVRSFESSTKALNADADRTCAEGGTIRIKVIAYSGAPIFHAAISLLGYVSNRST